MLREYPPEMPWVIVELKNQGFALATYDVREMILLPDVAAIPNVPEFVRGVINLRGRAMPLVDLRKRMGTVSATEEMDSFCGLMTQRESDHRNWLAELEASVKEHRAFKLTTDPHQCAFGKWYDNYQADNVWVAALLKKFDEPHKNIHSVGAQVETMLAGGQYEKAARLIESTRTHVLSVMIELFAALKDLLREIQREIAVILTVSGKTFGILVDSAVSVEKLVTGSVARLPAAAIASYNSVVQRVGKTRDDRLLLIIETDRVWSQK
jgi:chemotaxis signal transduction protein